MDRFKVQSGTMKLFVSAKDVFSAATKAIKKTKATSLGLITSCVNLDSKDHIDDRTFYVSTVRILEQNNMLENVPPADEELPIEENFTCDCGIVLNREKLEREQFDGNKYKQEYSCPVCKRSIFE